MEELKKGPSRFSNKAFFGVVALVAVVGAVTVFQSNAAKPVRPTTSGKSLYLSPAKGTLTVGNTLTVAVHENSGTKAVNAVQANFSYPTSKLEFVSIDATGSPFEIAAEGTGANGMVKIGRGTLTPVTGDQVVATVTFRNLAGGTAPLTFDAASALLASTDATNISTGTTGASYRITK